MKRMIANLLGIAAFSAATAVGGIGVAQAANPFACEGEQAGVPDKVEAMEEKVGEGLLPVCYEGAGFGVFEVGADHETKSGGVVECADPELAQSDVDSYVEENDISEPAEAMCIENSLYGAISVD